MKYLLDSNTCIRYINGRAPKSLNDLTHVHSSRLHQSANLG